MTTASIHPVLVPFASFVAAGVGIETVATTTPVVAGVETVATTMTRRAGVEKVATTGTRRASEKANEKQERRGSVNSTTLLRRNRISRTSLKPTLPSRSHR
jgi:hypothetical protein